MESKSLAGRRILMAEDTLDTSRFIATVLQGAGAEVVAVDNGRDAVDSALNDPFDVILMDVRMPELDGLTATRQLRQLGYDRPIVAFTSLAGAEHRRKCLVAGCDEHLALPSEPKRIVDVVSRFAGRINTEMSGA